ALPDRATFPYGNQVIVELVDALIPLAGIFAQTALNDMFHVTGQSDGRSLPCSRSTSLPLHPAGCHGRRRNTDDRTLDLRRAFAFELERIETGQELVQQATRRIDVACDTGHATRQLF